MAENSAPTTTPNEDSVIWHETGTLLRSFIVDRFEREGVANAPPREQIVGDESPGDVNLWIQSRPSLSNIVAYLDQDPVFQSIIRNVPDDPSVESIIAVAHVAFSDGPITWRRVVGVFYFTYQMILKALARSLADRMISRSDKLLGFINTLIKEMVRFSVNKFASWIIMRGGWYAIKEYIRSNALWITLVIAALAPIACVIYMERFQKN